MMINQLRLHRLHNQNQMWYPDMGLDFYFIIIFITAMHFHLIIKDKYSTRSLQIMKEAQPFIAVKHSRT